MAMRSLLWSSSSSSSSSPASSSLSSKESQKNGMSSGNGGRTHLYLNVYDLTPINNYLYWVGLGVFHSGIEDGSESVASSAGESEEEPDHHLLATPSRELVTFPRRP